MDVEKLKTLLDESQDTIIAGVRAKVIERVASNYEWQIADLVNKQVAEFFNAEVAPEIAKALLDEKGAIVEAAKEASARIAVKLGEEMFERALKNMSGYSFRNAFQQLFA